MIILFLRVLWKWRSAFFTPSHVVEEPRTLSSSADSASQAAKLLCSRLTATHFCSLKVQSWVSSFYPWSRSHVHQACHPLPERTHKLMHLFPVTVPLGTARSHLLSAVSSLHCFVDPLLSSCWPQWPTAASDSALDKCLVGVLWGSNCTETEAVTRNSWGAFLSPPTAVTQELAGSDCFLIVSFHPIPSQSSSV